MTSQITCYQSARDIQHVDKEGENIRQGKICSLRCLSPNDSLQTVMVRLKLSFVVTKLLY